MIVLNGDPSSMLLNDAFEIALEYEIPVSAPHRLFTKACSNMIRLQADERTWKQKAFGSKEVSIQMHIMQIHMQISVYRDKLDGYCINWKLLKYSSDSNSMISVFSNIHWVMTVNTFDSNFINWTQRIGVQRRDTHHYVLPWLIHHTSHALLITYSVLLSCQQRKN